MNSLRGKHVLIGAFLLVVTIVMIILIHSSHSSSKEWDQVLPSKTSQNKPPPTATHQTSGEMKTTEKPSVPAKSVMVDIKGAVNHPGVFTTNEGARVVDVLKLAGGVTKEADVNQINLAQHITDEMVIFVPKIGEVPPAPLAINGSSSPTPTSDQTKDSPVVHLNSATLTDLETLSGIGPSKAQAILDYRTKNGPFHKLDDLKNVTGIGDKSFEKISPQLVLN